MLFDRGGEFVDVFGGLAECVSAETEERFEDRCAEPADPCAQVLYRAAERLTHAFGGAADVGGDDTLEGGGIDFAVLDHFRQLGAGNLVFVLQPGEDRQPTVGEHLQVVGHGFAVGLDLVEDRAHVREGRLTDSSGVGDLRQILRQVLAGFDAGGHRRGSRVGGFVHAEGGALYRFERRFHDLVNSSGVVAQ